MYQTCSSWAIYSQIKSKDSVDKRIGFFFLLFYVYDNRITPISLKCKASIIIGNFASNPVIYMIPEWSGVLNSLWKKPFVCLSSSSSLFIKQISCPINSFLAFVAITIKTQEISLARTYGLEDLHLRSNCYKSSLNHFTFYISELSFLMQIVGQSQLLPPLFYHRL